jgi:hypothetical protein
MVILKVTQPRFTLSMPLALDRKLLKAESTRFWSFFDVSSQLAWHDHGDSDIQLDLKMADVFNCFINPVMKVSFPSKEATKKPLRCSKLSLYLFDSNMWSLSFSSLWPVIKIKCFSHSHIYQLVETASLASSISTEKNLLLLLFDQMKHTFVVHVYNV